jgi:hypothetical protein
MRFVEVHQRKPEDISVEDIEYFEQWFSVELEDALSLRIALEESWRDQMRMYEGVPKNPARNFPIENAPNFEVTVGAISVDALFAQTVDTVFSLKPFITIRPVPKKKDDKEVVTKAKSLERFSNWMVANELNVRSAGEEFFLSCIKYGTGALYIPWVERRTKAYSFTVKAAHPILKCHPIEDIIVPPGSYSDAQNIPWCGLRFWYSKNDLREDARRNNWNLGENEERIAAAGAKDWVKMRREMLARHAEVPSKTGDLFEIIKVWVYFDIDGDGINEDLFVTWDRTSRKVLSISFNPYDYRPVETAVYQRREHMFFGMGVLGMLAPFQQGVTDLYNWWCLNALLSNCMCFLSRTGTLDNPLTIWPMKNIETNGDVNADVKPFELGKPNPYIAHAMATTMSLAERRVGVNEMNISRPSQVLGSRTPGITALSMLQQINKRFTPAFDNMRLGISAGVRQALYRYQERLRSGDTAAMSHIIKVLGMDDAYLVISTLKDQTFDEQVTIELTAISATENKETERQNAVMLMNVLATYYQRTIELATIAANPQTPNEIRSIAKKISEATGEIVERTIRTFDQVRDPEAFIVRVEDEIDRMVGLDQSDMVTLAGLNTIMQNLFAKGAATQNVNTGEGT